MKKIALLIVLAVAFVTGSTLALTYHSQRPPADCPAGNC